MTRTIRLAGVSCTPPALDHSKGINLAPFRNIIQEVAHDKPHFICFPELCACGPGSDKKRDAVERQAFVEEVGKLAREFKTALVIPFAEREGDRVYNSVPIVDSQGKLVLVYRKNYPTDNEMRSGFMPGTEVPVGVCDGVRVGAAPHDMREWELILDSLRAACAQNDLPRVVEFDMAFHRWIVALPDEPGLLAMWLPIVCRMRLGYSKHEKLLDVYPEHLKIAAAFKKGNRKAAAKALEANIV